MNKAGFLKYLIISVLILLFLPGITGAMGSSPDDSGNSYMELSSTDTDEKTPLPTIIALSEEEITAISDMDTVREEKEAASLKNEFLIAESALKNSNTSINFFYSERCGACHKVLPVVKELSGKYPNIPVYYYDTYNSPENRSLMYRFAEYYGVDYPAYPNLFAGDSIYLEGFTKINNNIEDLFTAYDKNLIPDPEYEAECQEKWEGNVSPDNSGGYNFIERSGSGAGKVTLPLVLIGGLFDGINPCAISVLLILLASLSTAGSRRTILSAGISYTTAVFIFYTLAGAGILAITGFAGISVYFSVFAFVVALVAGVLSIYEGVTGRQQNLIRVPDSAKGTLKKYFRMLGDEEEYKSNRGSGSDENKTVKEDSPADESTNSNLLASYEQLSAELRIDESISDEILPSSDENATDEPISDNASTENNIPAENNTPEIIRNIRDGDKSSGKKTGYIITTAFILGTLASMFELPCTGGIYVAVLSMISSSFSGSSGSMTGDFTTAIIYLLLYNLMFILPLIIIIALMASGLPAGKIEKIDAFRTEKRRAIRIISGIVMIVLAVYLALGIAGII